MRGELSELSVLPLSGSDGDNATANNKQKPWQRVMRRVAREPMLHFVLAGALIFAGAYYFEHVHRNASQLIVIDAAIRNRLANLYALQLGAQPTPAQLNQLIDTYVHDEVLYREALALGLDQGDEIIRRRLVQKMGFLQNDLNIAEPPSDADLQRYYTQHAAEFVEPARISFEQQYFSADTDGDAVAYQRAAAALNKTALNKHVDAGRAASVDNSSLLPRYQQQTRSDLERLFGATPIVERLVTAEAGNWIGPVRSGYGWHIVRVTQHIAGTVPPFTAVRERVLTAVNDMRKEESNRRSFNELASHYTVAREDVKPASGNGQSANAGNVQSGDNSSAFGFNARAGDMVQR